MPKFYFSFLIWVLLVFLFPVEVLSHSLSTDSWGSVLANFFSLSFGGRAGHLWLSQSSSHLKVLLQSIHMTLSLPYCDMWVFYAWKGQICLCKPWNNLVHHTYIYKMDALHWLGLEQFVCQCIQSYILDMVFVWPITLDWVQISDFHGKQVMELPDQLLQIGPFIWR